MKKLIIAYLFTITNVFAAPPTYFNGELQTNTYIQNIKAPNYQTTPLGGINRRLETGNLNELQNPSFEHVTVASGWTVSNATSSSSTTRIEGSKSLSLALTGALSLSQSSTINAAQKSGVQMVASIWINSSDVSDLQLCSLKNGSEDKCTVTGGYVQGSGWRQLTVSFLGDSTSNGLKLKSTDTTGTVLVDQAYVGIGSPVVDFTPDMVYSAQADISGVVSGLNVSSWIGNATISGAIYTYPITGFTVAPNCWAVNSTHGAGSARLLNTKSTSTTVAVEVTNNAGATSSTTMSIGCEKTGADYKTSKAYVASGSLALNTTELSVQVSSAGSITKQSISGGFSGCVKNSTGDYTCTFGTTLSEYPLCWGNNQTGATTISVHTTTTSSVSYRTYNSSTSALRDDPAFIICQKQGADYKSAFNPVIVGSFQGYNETPGVSAPKTYSFKTSSTGVVSDDVGDLINGNCSISGTSIFTCTLNSGKITSVLNCSGSSYNAGFGAGVGFDSTSTSSLIFRTFITTTASASAQNSVITCHGY